MDHCPPLCYPLKNTFVVIRENPEKINPDYPVSATSGFIPDFADLCFKPCIYAGMSTTPLWHWQRTYHGADDKLEDKSLPALVLQPSM